MTIHTLPWGQKGYKDIGRANSYANNYVLLKMQVLIFIVQI